MMSENRKTDKNLCWASNSKYSICFRNKAKKRLIEENKSNKINPGIQKLLRGIEGCTKNSTIHGLKYMGDSAISYGERFFWLAAFLFALCGAIYFINDIYVKFINYPVIVTINAKPAPASEVPFPSVTICNMNLVVKSVALKIIENGTLEEKSFLQDLCSFNSTRSTEENITGDWQDVLDFMDKVHQPCSQLIKFCKFNSIVFNCEQIFRTILTNNGLCCNFNGLPVDYILRNPEYRITLNETNFSNRYQIDDWNSQRGYTQGAPKDVYPFRTPGPGTDLGLSLVLDLDLDNYYCSSTSSYGVQTLLHSPLELPNVLGFAFLLTEGTEVRANFKPNIQEATDSLKSISVSNRQCYFLEERYLRYYRTYTKNNCRLECMTNITLGRCGCVPFYLPKMIELNDVEDEEKNCDCLPGCFELSFDKSISFGKLSNKFQVREEISQNKSLDYFQSNMCVVHIFSVTSNFKKFIKNDGYGYSEFLANIGGMLSLFLGFSFLSFGEIMYYSMLRLIQLMKKRS